MKDVEIKIDDVTSIIVGEISPRSTDENELYIPKREIKINTKGGSFIIKLTAEGLLKQTENLKIRVLNATGVII